MQIVGFHPDSSLPGNLVGIALEDMPGDASEANTEVHLKGIPMDIQAVEPELGSLEVHIGDMARTGPFKVTINGKGGPVEATSAEFTVEGDHLDPDGTPKPRVTVMVPKFVTGEAQVVTLRGTHLAGVRGATVDGRITTFRGKATDTVLSFTLPRGLAQGMHQIMLASGKSLTRYACPWKIEVR